MEFRTFFYLIEFLAPFYTSKILAVNSKKIERQKNINNQKSRENHKHSFIICK